MAVEFKDYYKSLGVERSAGDEEIRKAFRKLARQYHPDVAKDKKSAEEKFKEINEAYEVLSDPEKRKRYDQLGANWKQGAQFRPPPGWQQRARRPGGSAEPFGDSEFQFGGTGFSDFFEQFFGSKGGQRGGFDFREGSEELSERGQDVEADLLVTLEEALNGSIRPVSLRRNATCERCGGSGEIKNRPCPVCQGSGRTGRIENYQVKIPAGVREGQRLRLAGRGEAGVGRAPAGDLFLRVRFAKHPDYRVEGDDLFYDLDLAPWEAVLGAQVSVPTLEGRVSIKIPPGAQNAQRMRVRGHGLPFRSGGRGDLYVLLRVQVPERATDREKALWEQLSRESRFNPRD